MVNNHRELILNYSDNFEFIIKNSKFKIKKGPILTNKPLRP